jgi:hypothetical protein
MFRVTPDQSVLDRNGKVIFFSVERFISDIANGDCCFTCGAQRGSVPFNDEHVLPNWILRRFGLHGRTIEIHNHTDFRYSGMTIPCCVTCNTEMGKVFENPMSELFAGGFDAVSKYLKERGPWDLFRWMGLIFLKAHLKNKYLNYHRDSRKGDMKISELHSWEELHHLHCVARSFHSGAKLDMEVLGSLCVLPAKVRPHFEGFDFIDLTAAQTMLLCIGDVAIIAVFNDSQAALSIAHEDFNRIIGGPLSPLQLRELAARLASVSLQVEPRTRFISDIDAIGEDYWIRAERPDQVHLPAWDDDLHGAIMHALTKDMVKQIDNGEEILNLVKTGRYTFLTTPEGTFDFNSMELEPITDHHSEEQ